MDLTSEVGQILSTPFKVLLPRDVHDAMLAQALAELPNECCGQLGGVREPGLLRVTRRYPLVNAAASPIAYDADPKSLFAAHKAMRLEGIDLVAIYHSHPTSEPIPSQTDRDRNYWGADVVHFIISLAGTEPRMRGWRIDGQEVSEADWEVA